MDIELIAWVFGVWLLVSVAVSLTAGRMFQHASTTEAELERASSRQKVVRYLRQRKSPGKTLKSRVAV